MAASPSFSFLAIASFILKIGMNFLLSMWTSRYFDSIKGLVTRSFEYFSSIIFWGKALFPDELERFRVDPCTLLKPTGLFAEALLSENSTKCME